MKIIFISNFLNHHQIPLCEAFCNLPDVEFTFIATEGVPTERIKLGYKHAFSHLSYFFEAIEEQDKIKAEMICFASDVVIFGSAPMYFVKRRLHAHKLTFNYNERWFKEGFWKHPGDIYRAIRDFTQYNNNYYYQLCASAYTAYDSNRVYAFPGRKYRWGYFPKVVKYENIGEVITNKKPMSILWVARFIDWKHPEVAIEVANRLKADGIHFSLDMIGNGEMEEKLKALIEREGLGDYVHMLGSMSPEQVRQCMEQSQIFLFTSDFREGWGAVLNEAMNSGCTVVASHAIGSVPYLIKQGENGFIYSNGNNEELYEYVKRSLVDKNLAAYLGKNAYFTMLDKWNGDIAANRLYNFCLAKLSNSTLPVYSDGPLSRDFGKVKNYGKFKHKEY